MSNPTDLGNKLVELGVDWMNEATTIALSHYNSFDASSGVMTKDDDSPLTLADLALDVFIGRKLLENFAEIPVVTEERSASHNLNVGEGMFFLVDPLDGTREFINKRDEFTINIALLNNRRPVGGLVCAPALGVTYAGVKGQGAFKVHTNGSDRQAICVAKADNNALRVVASRSHLTPETRDFIEANSVSCTKNAGSSLKFCLLASGEADLYPRFGPTMEWDTAAGDAVLRAAGGSVVTLEGKSLSYGKSQFRNGWFIASANDADYQTPSHLSEPQSS